MQHHSYTRGDNKDDKKYPLVQLLEHELQTLKEQSSDSNLYEESFSENLSQIKAKRSLFSSFIKRKRSKNSDMKLKKGTKSCSSLNIASDSDSSEKEICHYHYSETSLRNPPFKESRYSKQKKNIFKKMIKCTSSEIIKLSKKEKHCCDKGKKCEVRALQPVTLSKIVPTSFIPKHSLKLINGLNELQDVLHNLHHCEEHMVYLLRKYVEDKNIAKQILDTSFEYFAHQFDCKKLSSVLANKMWEQELEVRKVQDYSLQKRLNYLVKTNRSLESKLELLHRQCEKLAGRCNFYPKRFLHMRSFGKVYARQLMDNNRKLVKKVNALTGVISDFEEELQKLQRHKDGLEEEKQSFKSQVYHLEGVLEKHHADYSLEKSVFMTQLNQQQNVLNEALNASQFIIQDINEFQRQLIDAGLKFPWSKLKIDNRGVPDVIYEIRTYLSEIFVTLFTAYKNASAVAQEITKLRQTNARLQENLQRSASELNSLSKKIEKCSETDLCHVEARSFKLEQQNSILKTKLGILTEENTILKEEIESKLENLEKTKSTNIELINKNQTCSKKIDELVEKTSQYYSQEYSSFRSNDEKLDLLKNRFDQVLEEKNQIAENLNKVKSENQNFLKVQEANQQEVASLHETVKSLTDESEVLKKQLNSEHQTVLTLQNERLKYLEEKNLLKTIFHYLKSEIQRIQQLEGAVADMTKETNRLSLIAEFNKQVGDQLKNEVELKENVIAELRQSLEKLSHIQVDNDKEKMNLCAQLSEVVTVKDKLTDCLEHELKRNGDLDELKKKLESTATSQIKMYEEMQKNERAALKELLKDFKEITAQRDYLVAWQDEATKKYKGMEKKYQDLKKQHDLVITETNYKEEEMKNLIEKLSSKEKQVKKIEDVHSSEITKYGKTIRKLEKILNQLRNEKRDVDKNNECLKHNLDRIQIELANTKESFLVVDHKLTEKEAKLSTLESELAMYKNELHNLQQEHSKIMLELDFHRKSQEQQLADTISNFTYKESMYKESCALLLSKEQEICDLKKKVSELENELKCLEQDYNYLKKQNDDQTKIMIGYENHLTLLQDVEASKLKLEKDFSNLEIEHRSKISELENARREIDTLTSEMRALIARNEKERAFYKKQTNEIISEYSEQKDNIEDEIETISHQLQTVTENLHSEKRRFEALEHTHEALQLQYNQILEKLNSEIAAHREAELTVENLKQMINSMSHEREKFERQYIDAIRVIDEEKYNYDDLYQENQRMQAILEQGKKQYTIALDKNADMEQQIATLKHDLNNVTHLKTSNQNEVESIIVKLEEKNAELKLAKDTIHSLQNGLNDTQKALFELKEEYFKLQQHVTGLEFKNCELTLQLHEINEKLETERNLYEELKQQEPEELSLAPSECGEMFYTTNL